MHWEKLGSFLDRQTWWRILRLSIEDDVAGGRVGLYETRQICWFVLFRKHVQIVVKATKLQQYPC